MQIAATAKLTEKVKPLGNEYLSTGTEMNPLLLLETLGEKSVVLCAVAVWTREVMTGNLAEKGGWIRNFWTAARRKLPKAIGCRLGWNTVFFAVPFSDADQIAEQFSRLLSEHRDDCLASFAVVCKVEGTPQHKIEVLNVLGHEIGSERSFGASRSYQPNGHKFIHLLDGKPYIVK